MCASTPRQRGDARRGLTILELAIAVAIVAALTAIAIPQYLGYVRRAEVKQAVVDIRMLEGAIDRYRSEFGMPPDQLADAVDAAPTDPWGNPYQYLNLQSGEPEVVGKSRKDKNLVPLNSDYDLYSKGADGESKPPLTAKASQDDVVRANDGTFVGLGEDY